MTDYKGFSDQELLHLAQQEDVGAFTAIYRKHWQTLYNSAYKRNRDKAQCEDIVQNVFIDFWSRKNELRIDNLAAYLHTAVRFQLFKQTTRQPLQAIFLDNFDEILSSPLRADDGLIEREILPLITLWIAALPKKRRKIFIMYYTDELSTGEIAESLGISQKTVQNQLNTASQNIRAHLSHLMSVSLLASFLIK